MWFKGYETLLAIQGEMASRNILITHGDRKVQGQRMFFFFKLEVSCGTWPQKHVGNREEARFETCKAQS